MSPNRASDLTGKILSSGRLAQYAPVAERMIRYLLEMGANADLGNRLGGRSFPGFTAMLILLPPFLEAGMDFKGRRPTGRPRRRRGVREERHQKEDLLGYASAYDKDLDEEGSSAQLAVVRLLLQHGVTIGGPTRGNALDSLTSTTADGRAGWAFKLCSALVDHCRQTPRDQRGEDQSVFLARLRRSLRWKRGGVGRGLWRPGLT